MSRTSTVFDDAHDVGVAGALEPGDSADASPIPLVTKAAVAIAITADVPRLHIMILRQ
jgi:hypothetical protein